MSDSILGLSGDGYWHGMPDPDALFERLADEDTPGIFLDAPRQVSIHRRSVLPVYIAYCRSFAEQRRVDAHQGLVLVGVRMRDNRLFAGLALRSDDDPEGTPAVLDDEPIEGYVGETYDVDARAQLGLPWERGDYTFVALLHDRVSNPQVVTVGTEPGEFVDDAVEAYLAERDRRAEVDVDSVWPRLDQIRGAIARTLDGGPAPFPNYRPHADSPPIPDGLGIALSVPRVTEAGRGQRCVVRGSFRLPCTAHERVSVDPSSGRLADVGAPGATAVVTIHLVGTSTRFGGPFITPLRVPSFDAVDPTTDSVVTGSFNIDLFELPGIPQMPDTYFFTAISRDIRTAPQVIGVAPPPRR